MRLCMIQRPFITSFITSADSSSSSSAGSGRKWQVVMNNGLLIIAYLSFRKVVEVN